MSGRGRRLVPIAVLALSTACAARAAREVPVDAQQAWLDAFIEAQQLAGEGRVAGADSALARFVVRHPDSPEATETLYWRAILALDPANQSAGPADAVRMLDAYLATTTPVVHTMEAASLRRTARALDSLGRNLTSARALADSASNAAKTAATASPEEMQKLKDELTRTQAELERIRKRLSNPQGRP